MRHVVLMLLPLASLAILAGCGPDYSPNTYTSAAVQQANKADQGVVIGVRRVDVTTSGATGAAVGAAAGGIAGSGTPGGVGSAFGALGGALVGGLVGTAAEHTATETFAYEYIVKKTGGELVSVTQKDSTPLALGQKVLVIAGNQARIVPDYTVTLDAPAKPDAAKPDAAGKDTAAKRDATGKVPPAGTEPPPTPVVLSPLPPPSTQASVDKAGLPIQIAPPPTVPPAPPAPSLPPGDAAAANAGATAALAATGAGPAPAAGAPAVPVAPTTLTPPAKAQ